jgi:hypothetical protein
MEHHAAWLSQGDVFEQLPIFRCVVAGNGIDIERTRDIGAAILLTEGCQLDKKSQGISTVETLSFAPIYALDESNIPDIDHQKMLRSGQKKLYGVTYVSNTSDGGEGVAFFRDTYGLPASYFDIQLKQFEDDGKSELRAVAVSNDRRSGTLDADERDFMKWKLAAFWSGSTPKLV